MNERPTLSSSEPERKPPMEDPPKQKAPLRDPPEAPPVQRDPVPKGPDGEPKRIDDPPPTERGGDISTGAG